MTTLRNFVILHRRKTPYKHHITTKILLCKLFTLCKNNKKLKCDNPNKNTKLHKLHCFKLDTTKDTLGLKNRKLCVV